MSVSEVARTGNHQPPLRVEPGSRMRPQVDAAYVAVMTCPLGASPGWRRWLL
jgi:hypothetical protein